MKKIFFVFLLGLIGKLHAQNDSRSLAASQSFIDMVSSIANKQLDIRDDFKNQLQSNYSSFCQTIKNSSTDAEIDAVVTQYNLNREYSYDAMSEHLTHQYNVVNQSSWLKGLSDFERKEAVKAAYLEGMASEDARWLALKEQLSSRVGPVNYLNKTVGQIIVGCVQETIEATFNFAAEVALVSYAINEGSFWDTVKAIKKLIKKVGPRLGWWGLAIAAWDIGTCIYNEL